MKVPNAERALVDREKITDYLLDPTHPDNGGKAEFFFAAGFTKAEWQKLATALLELLRLNEVTKTFETRHGIKYIVDGKLLTATESHELRSIWIVDRGNDVARLVTAYPKRR